MEKIIDTISNKENQDCIVTLCAENGKEVDFIEIAGIAYKGNFYAILQPVELLDGMNEDEALVFRVRTDEDGKDTFDVELDDEVIEAVFKEYEKLYDDAVGDSGETD